MRVAKSTIARIETMEMAAKGDFLVKAMGLFRQQGIQIELFGPDKIEILINESAITLALKTLQDETKRRVDRRMKSGIGSLLPESKE